MVDQIQGLTLDDIRDALGGQGQSTSFEWGVGLGGFPTEGGFNGPGEPINDWRDWEYDGLVDASGNAVSSWSEPEQLMKLLPEAGASSLLLGIEWARIQPSYEPGEEIPPVDEGALAGYSRLVELARENGAEPVIALSQHAYPEWLGHRPWLSVEAARAFAGYARSAVEGINSRLGDRPVRQWIPLRTINLGPVGAYGAGVLPPGMAGSATRVMRAFDVSVAAHCLAYDAIHDAFESHGWGEAEVWYDSRSWSIYELDRLGLDVLLARENGSARQDISEYLTDARRCQVDLISRIPATGGAGWRGQLGRAAGAIARALTLDPALPYAIDAVYASERDRKVDAISVGYENPFLGSYVRLPLRGRGSSRSWRAVAHPWEVAAAPAGLYWFLRAAAINAPGRPVVAGRIGMANRVRNGVSFPRPDRMTRDRYMREHVLQALRAAADGVPLAGIYYGALVDEYFWGTYEPRYGLFGVDRSRGNRILPTDAMGVSAARVLRELAEAYRTGDAALLASAIRGA